MQDTFTRNSQSNHPDETNGENNSGTTTGSPYRFLVDLLSLQTLLLQAEGGAVIRLTGEKKVDVLAVYPPLSGEKASCPAWVIQSTESLVRTLSTENVLVIPLRSSEHAGGRQASYNIFLTRLNPGDIQNSAAVFLVPAGDRRDAETKCRLLQLSLRLVAMSESRTIQREKSGELKRYEKALSSLSAVNEKVHFKQISMAFCNELAAQWQCERVSLGFLRERYVQVNAMSHTEDFSRKSEIVQAIESAMEECLDQDMEVLSHAPEGAVYISRAADDLSRHSGSLAVLSLPLRHAGKVFAVVTLERPADRRFITEEVETLRLTCDISSARLADMFEHGRWFGATLGVMARGIMTKLTGPRNITAKAAAIACAVILLFLIFAKGQFKIESPFAMEATYQQVIPAPFDGYLKDVKVEINNHVEANSTVLATLDTADLRLQLAAAKAEYIRYLKQAYASMQAGEIAQSHIAQANADKMTAQVNLLAYQISRASILSPINGIVTKGDLKRQIGAPVRTGDVLFEVSPIEALRAEILVPEDEVPYIQSGQDGYLATASFPEKKMKFTVEHVNPVAEVINQRNVFKVRVNLQEAYSWLRPGMEGVAKVSIGQRRYVWIWTHKAVNWVRMKLWI